MIFIILLKYNWNFGYFQNFIIDAYKTCSLLITNIQNAIEIYSNYEENYF